MGPAWSVLCSSPARTKGAVLFAKYAASRNPIGSGSTPVCFAHRVEAHHLSTYSAALCQVERDVVCPLSSWLIFSFRFGVPLSLLGLLLLRKQEDWTRGSAATSASFEPERRRQVTPTFQIVLGRAPSRAQRWYGGGGRAGRGSPPLLWVQFTTRTPSMTHLITLLGQFRPWGVFYARAVSCPTIARKRPPRLPKSK